MGCSVGSAEAQQIKRSGGESGIRTHARSMASITCINYIATDTKFATLAAHHCTLLHAGKIGYLNKP
jgi:hypothetical protein